MVAGQLAKAIITVNDGPVHDLGISQHKVCVCGKSTRGYGEKAGERNQAQGQKVNSKKTRGRRYMVMSHEAGWVDTVTVAESH